jgi:protein TonB
MKKWYKMACLVLCLFGVVACKDKKPDTKALKSFSVVGVTGKDDANVNDEAESDMVFIIVDEPPQFPGGMGKCQKWLKENLKYPAEAPDVSGKVFVEFVVGSDSVIRNVVVLRGLDPVLDAEAVRVMNTMPKWIPGKQGGNPVSVKFTMPLTFAPSQQ